MRLHTIAGSYDSTPRRIRTTVCYQRADKGRSRIKQPEGRGRGEIPCISFRSRCVRALHSVGKNDVLEKQEQSWRLLPRSETPVSRVFHPTRQAAPKVPPLLQVIISSGSENQGVYADEHQPPFPKMSEDHEISQRGMLLFGAIMSF